MLQIAALQRDVQEVRVAVFWPRCLLSVCRSFSLSLSRHSHFFVVCFAVLFAFSPTPSICLCLVADELRSTVLDPLPLSVCVYVCLSVCHPQRLLQQRQHTDVGARADFLKAWQVNIFHDKCHKLQSVISIV